MNKDVEFRVREIADLLDLDPIEVAAGLINLQKRVIDHHKAHVVDRFATNTTEKAWRAIDSYMPREGERWRWAKGVREQDLTVEYVRWQEETGEWWVGTHALAPARGVEPFAQNELGHFLRSAYLIQPAPGDE